MGRMAEFSTVGELIARFIRRKGQSRSARSVELFGWLDYALGNIIFFAPQLTVSLLRVPPLGPQGESYLRLVGLLVSGLGMLYIVSGRLNAEGFVFASMLDRPLVPIVMAVLWRRGIMPGALALAFSLSDFGGFLFTAFAWRAERRAAAGAPEGSAVARFIGAIFGFTSGVVRNSRTFHPDGRTFLATVRALAPADPAFARAGERLAGDLLVRAGMGLLKRGMPLWLARIVPDAPSIALRFFNGSAHGEVRLERRPGEDLDLLCTAGGDRLWKLILNLSFGGFWGGLDRFNFARNVYFAEVSHEVEGSDLDLWIRLAPTAAWKDATAPLSRDLAGRDEGLTRAIADDATINIEAQRAGAGAQPFVPIAEIRFAQEVTIDQETLHFDPGEGRGFAAHGFLTTLRYTVYPAAVRKRPHSRQEREDRGREGFWRRWGRFLD